MLGRKRQSNCENVTGKAKLEYWKGTRRIGSEDCRGQDERGPESEPASNTKMVVVVYDRDEGTVGITEQ